MRSRNLFHILVVFTMLAGLVCAKADNTDITTGLVLYYPFDSDAGSVVADQSNQYNTGTVFGATWTSNGKMGGAYEFDGVNDYIMVRDRNCLDLSNSFAVSAWVNPAILNENYRAVLTKHNASPGRSGYCLETGNGDGGAWFQTGDGSTWGNGNAWSPAGTLITNQWQHVVATFDGSSLRLYRDGVQVASDTSVNSVAPNTRDLWIGAHVDLGGDPYFKGGIDEVSVIAYCPAMR